MNTDVKTFLVSLVLHLVVVGSAVSFAGMPTLREKPVLIDFTINGTIAEQAVKKSDPGEAPPPPRSLPAPKVKTVRSHPVSSEPQPHPEPVAAPVPMEASPAAVPVAAPVATAPAQPVPAANNSNVVASSIFGSGHTVRGIGTPGGSGVNSPGNGPKGESTETLRMRYMKKHFAYIRDLVAANMRYPGLARRMGWSGKLTVEFVVQKDGSATTIRVVNSSGVPLLDSDARDTVVRSGPFPKPPVSARLVIPVEYKLEN